MRWLFAILTWIISFSALSSDLIVRTSDEQSYTITHAELVQNLQETTFTTHLPWLDQANEFSGFAVTDLLKHLKIDDTFAVSFIALNDYTASSKIDDLIKYKPIIAYKQNGKKMKVRDKGPYWLIFNLDQYPEIDKAEFHSQMVWQIDELMVYRKQDVDTQ
jgi:hypothetical protein